MFDLLSIGDVTWDTFLGIDDATVHCNRRDRSCELCLRYGAKVPVQEFWESPGGNSANVAVGIAALDGSVALVSKVGADDDGKKIITFLQRKHIPSRYIQKDRIHETHHSTVIRFQGERTILVKKNPLRIQLPNPFPKTKWVYLSSLSQASESFYKKLLDGKEKNNFKIAFNPNQMQLHGSVNSLEKFLSSVDALFVNKEEAALLVQRLHNSPQPSLILREGARAISPLKVRGDKRGVMQQDETDQLLFTLSSLLTPSGFVFITDGPRGAYATNGKAYYYLKAFPVKKIADPTGAGDAFASGVLAGLRHSERFPEVMRWGMAQSAAVLREIGAQNGLLNLREMKRVLKRVKIFPTTNLLHFNNR